MTSSEPQKDDDELPERLQALVDRLIGSSGLDGPAAARARADLVEHFREGLLRGRSVEELVERFGDPESAARLLRRHPAPAGTERDGIRRDTGRHGGDRLVGSMLADARHALRGLARSPTVALTAVVVLALGLGANTVVFTVLNELLLRPLPVAEPESLVDVWADIPGDNSFTGFSYDDYVTFREENRVLAELAAFSGRRLDLGSEATAGSVTGQFVTPGYFEMLGLSASRGDASLAGRTRFGEEPVAVLSHGFWTDAYGSDPAVVGDVIRLEGRAVTVVGVGPEGFAGHFIGFPVDVWLPLAALDPLVAGYDPQDPARKDLELIGRLRPGVTVASAEADLDGIAEEIERRRPDVNRGHRVGVTPTTGLDHSLHGPVRAFVGVLTVVSLLVLVIACLNVGGLLLVRAMARERELAVRVALGAGRTRVLRHLVTESFVLAVAGGLLGVWVAIRMNEILVSGLRAFGAGIGLELSVDWRVLALTGVVALAASLLATMAPGLHALRRDPAGVLRARGGDDRASVRLRSALVVGQVAVSVVLVVGTGLFVRALDRATRADPGFAADSVATMVLDARALGAGAADVGRLETGRMDTDDQEGSGLRSETRRQIALALDRLRDVQGVALASAPPIGVGRTPAVVEVPGIPPPPDADAHHVDARWVGADYLETLGIGLLVGRGIEEHDVPDGPQVAVVSAAFDRRYRAGRSLVGTSVVVDGKETRIVGVAADARYVVQDGTPDPLIYLSAGSDGPETPFVTVRAADPDAVRDAVHRAVSEVVPGHRRTRLRTGRQVLDTALLPQRIGAAIVGAMGLAALFLAAVGLYGLVQFTVARDTHELGVRLALGGGRRELLAVVLRKGARLVLVGTVVGVAVALGLAPGLSAFLAGVSPADPVTYFTVVSVFALVALAASWIPARRAMRIDAVEALRSE